MLHATAAPTVDDTPTPPRKSAGPQVRIKDLAAPIASVQETGETLNSFIRSAIRAEVARRRAAVAAELRDLDDREWTLLLMGAAR